jgi:4-aminobutyrate aminotransferase/(S)-3-amino-2-methylpropionate transaminase
MLGLELIKGPDRAPAPEEAKALSAACFENGLSILVCGSYGNIIRILAPFVITDEQLNKGLDIMENGIKKISS